MVAAHYEQDEDCTAVRIIPRTIVGWVRVTPVALNLAR